MFFRRRHIFIFAESSGEAMRVRMRSWPIYLFFGLLFLMVVLLFFLWRTKLKYDETERLLVQTVDLGVAQQDRLMDMTFQFKELGKRYSRIHDFNVKLGVMFSQDPEQPFYQGYEDPTRDEEFYDEHPDLYAPKNLTRDMFMLIKQMEEGMGLSEITQQKLRYIITFKKNDVQVIQLIPALWPVHGKITSPFGWRRHPVGGYSSFHPAMDISTQSGTPIRAPAPGEVIEIGYDGAYGNKIVIRHDAKFTTLYAHLSRYNVKLKQYVKRGEVIGFVGSTGRSTGPHLHYEVLVHDTPVNPKNYMLY